ncbi:MAG: L-threonine-O-3-phosphate decarboxylase [Deltaproteobacteria bacterium]|nr:L-threonine-O-3-phosphate decarboxylase [Deltaproteobacteria bacterium]
MKDLPMIPTDDSLFGSVSKSRLDSGQVLDFSIPLNPLGPSKRVERKVVKGLSAAFRHADALGAELIRTLAQFHGLSEEEILLGAGATEFIHGIPRALSFRRVLMVTPIFREYERALEQTVCAPKVRIDYFEAREEDGFEVDVNGLISSLTLGYDALYLSNPGFPTGILTSQEDLLRVLAQTESQRTWFILDETSLDFVEEQSLKRRIRSSSHFLILRTFSNFFSIPGMRVGYLLGNREAIQKCRAVLPPRTINTLAQIAALESLQDQTHIRRTQEWMPKERERLAQALRAIPGFVPYPGTANFLLVQLLPFLGIDGGELRELLLRQEILVDDCRSYPSLAPYFVFIAMRTRRENNLLIKALRQIVGSLPVSSNPSQTS